MNIQYIYICIQYKYIYYVIYIYYIISYYMYIYIYVYCILPAKRPQICASRICRSYICQPIPKPHVARLRKHTGEIRWGRSVECAKCKTCFPRMRSEGFWFSWYCRGSGGGGVVVGRCVWRGSRNCYRTWRFEVANMHFMHFMHFKSRISYGRRGTW